MTPVVAGMSTAAHVLVIVLAAAVIAFIVHLVSDLFGISYPPATFMLLALSFLLILVLHFSWELSRLEDRTRALAEEHALLRQEVEERLHPPSGGASA